MELENKVTETELEAPVQAAEKPEQIAPEQSEELSEQQVKEAEPLTFDLLAFEKEYSENGGLSEDSYKTLEKAGINKAVVDNYIAGQKAIVASIVDGIKKSVGGVADYNKMTAWASQNLTEAEKDAFNKTVNSMDMEQARLAVEGLNNRYKASFGYAPARQVEGGDNVRANGYASMAEMVRDVQDTRYKSDEAYRAKVVAKAARSKF